MRFGRIEKPSRPLDHYVGVAFVGATTRGDEWYSVVDDDDAAEFFIVWLTTPDGSAEHVAHVADAGRAEVIAIGFASLMGWAQRAPDGRPHRVLGELGDVTA